jgi:hypothetical protein
MVGGLEIEWRHPLENPFHDFLQKVRGCSDGFTKLQEGKQPAKKYSFGNR